MKHKRLRALVGVIGMAMSLLIVGAGSSSAAVPLKVVTNGMKIIKTSSLPFQYCTLGPVGTDSQGNLVGISAGHCWKEFQAKFPDGNIPKGVQPIYDENDRAFGPIGDVRFINPDNDGKTSLADYQVIKFDETKVALSSNGPALRIDSTWSGGVAPVNGNICKDGQTTGKTCGVVISNTNGIMMSYASNFLGDSGGPVVVARNNGQATEWVGITSAFFLNGTFRYTSAKNILDDLNPRGIVGSGFTPINN